MIAPPILRSMPALVVGMPVWRVKLRLACVMPSALFHENERPEIPVFDLRDMIIKYLLYCRLFAIGQQVPQFSYP